MPLRESSDFYWREYMQKESKTKRQITELEKPETENQQEEELYRTLAEKSFGGVYVVQDGVFRYLNSHAAAYAGYTPEELIGKQAPSIVHPEDKETQRKNASDMLKGIRSYPYEFRIINGNGEVRWIMETVTTIVYKGRPAILGNSMDITEHKQVEELYKTLTENSLAVIFIIHDGKFRFINNSAIAYAGYSAEELVGQDSDLMVHPEDREMVKRKGRSMLMDRKTIPYEFRMITKQGQIRWITQIVSPIQYEGKPAILGNAIDITERKRLKEEILQLTTRT